MGGEVDAGVSRESAALVCLPASVDLERRGWTQQGLRAQEGLALGREGQEGVEEVSSDSAHSYRRVLEVSS